jgi:hypothetical protein
VVISEPYGVLGLQPDASFEEVRRSYRQRAQETHPDANGPEGVDRFLSVQRAYEAIAQERAATRGAAYGPTGAAIVHRGVVVPDVAEAAAPPPRSPPFAPSPPRIDLFAVLAAPRPEDAHAAYLRHLRVAPPSLIDICA